MGDLLSLFWEMDPPPKPLTLTIPKQDYECRKDDSCMAIGSFLLWYFAIISLVMLFCRTSVWISEKKKKGGDSDTSASGSKASRDASYKQQSKDTVWDSVQMMQKLKHIQLMTPITDSEASLINTYLGQRRFRHHSQLTQGNLIQHDSDTTDYDSEESNSGSSSWKESVSEHQPSPPSIKRRTVHGQKDLRCFRVRDKPCRHCKALRTNEWLTRHFLQNPLVAAPKKGDTQEKKSPLDLKTKFSKF